MTALEAPRGAVRAALSSVLPHTGRETDDTPTLGRVRLLATGDGLLVWATDHRTSALARVEHPEYADGELLGWDMPADAVKKVLSVFRGPSNADARQMWDDQPMRVEVTDSQVTFTEVGSIVDGQSLTVARIVEAGEDRYPDVPRELVTLTAAVRQTPAATALFHLEALARFTAAAKAYGGDIPLASLTPGHGLTRALLRIGHLFLGAVPTYPDARQSPGDVEVAQAEQRTWWTTLLAPLERPVPVRVSQAVTEDLVRQAADVLGGGGPVTLRVVRDADPDWEDS